MMAEVTIYLRRINGICTKVQVDLTSSLSQFNELASQVLKCSSNSFAMYNQGNKIDSQDVSTNLGAIYLKANSIIDIIEIDNEKPIQITILIEFQGHIDSLSVNQLEPISSIRHRISEIINTSYTDFHLFLRGSPIHHQSSTPTDLQLKDKQIINIKRKTGLMNGLALPGHIKMVESIASSSDKNSKKHALPPRIEAENKVWNLKKKNSFTFSLKNISDEQKNTEIVKKSAIEPIRKNYDFMSSPPSGLTQISDIKETMSFGSLEQPKKDGFEVILINTEQTREYKFSCLLGCTGGEIRVKLAKIERVNVLQVIIEEIDDEEELQNLLDWSEGNESVPHLVFKVLKNT